jgi:alpha-galactosidase
MLAEAVVMLAATLPARASDPDWALATSTTEIRLGIRDGKTALLALHAAGSPWEWLQTADAEDLPGSVRQGNVPLDLHWAYTRAVETYDGNRRTLTLYFSNDSPRLELKSVWQAVAGPGPVEHWVVLRNASGARLTIGSQPSLRLHALAFPRGHYVESTQVLRGGSNAQVAGGVLSRPVGQYWDVLVPSKPSDGGAPNSSIVDSTTQVPYLNLQVDNTHGLYVGWQFSAVGNITGSSDGTKVALSIGLPDDFTTDILPGEEFLVPAAFIGAYVGTQSAGSYSLYRYVLDSLLPRLPPAQPFPSLVYGYYFDGTKPGTQTETEVLASAAQAQNLGFETFLADAMWFPQSGDWRWDPARFPRGSRPLADYLHANGMKFALWMAWTQAPSGAAPGAIHYEEHPDWFTHAPEYAVGDNINWHAQVDVGNDDARRWVELETQRVVREYQVDYLKTDFSPIAITSRARHVHGEHITDVSYWSTLGYYRIQDGLLRKFPTLMLEGCSGGGRIKDFGNIAHVHYIVGTDTLSALADRQSLYDTSFMFPPATIQLYTYDDIYSDVSDAPEPYLWRSGMMGAWDLALTDSARLSERQKTAIRRSTEVYKSWVRPVLEDAHVYRILPRPDGLHWDGMFYWNETTGKGMAYVFRPNSERSHELILLEGLEPAGLYYIRGEDGAVAAGVLSGKALMNEGIPVTLAERFRSELVFVEDVRAANGHPSTPADH